MAEEKKKKSFFSFLRKDKKEQDIFQEEQVQSPLRTIVSNFLHNRIAMTGVVVFLAIFIFVMIGPHIWVLDLGYEDNTQVNIAPGLDMMSYPRALANEGVQKIAVGSTFSVGCSKEGHVYVWGKSKITEIIDVRDIPEEVKNAKIVDVAAGQDHVVALDEQGNIYVWGNTRQGQDKIPDDLKRLRNDKIKQIAAGYQASVAVTENGQLFVWGNTNIFDAKINKATKDQKIEKAVCTSYAYVVLTKNGQVIYPGLESNAFSNIPDSLSSDVVDITASSQTVAALKKDGTVVVWGNASNGEANLPEFPAKIVNIEARRRQERGHHILAHLMHIALDRADDHRNGFFALLVRLLQLRLQNLQCCLERVGSQHDFRQEHFHLLERLAELVQSFRQRADGLHRIDALGHGLLRCFQRRVLVKLQNCAFQLSQNIRHASYILSINV